MIKTNAIKNAGKWNYDIPIHEIKNDYDIWLNKSIIVKGTDIDKEYTDRVFIVFFLREIVENGFIVSLDPFGSNHKMIVPKIYYFI
jgi:hypothetical protein